MIALADDFIVDDVGIDFGEMYVLPFGCIVS